METLVLVSFYVAFVVGISEQVVSLGKFRALLSLAAAAIGVLVLGVQGAEAAIIGAGAAFAGTFLAALGDRISIIQLAVTRQIGQRD
jgi:hypothetical protein